MHDPTYALHVRFITPERCFDSLPFLLPCISPCPCPTRGASIFSASRSTKTGFETRHRCCRLVTAFHLLPSCKRTLILFPERKARRTLPKLTFLFSWEAPQNTVDASAVEARARPAPIVRAATVRGRGASLPEEMSLREGCTAFVFTISRAADHICIRTAKKACQHKSGARIRRPVSIRRTDPSSKPKVCTVKEYEPEHASALDHYCGKILRMKRTHRSCRS